MFRGSAQPARIEKVLKRNAMHAPILQEIGEAHTGCSSSLDTVVSTQIYTQVHTCCSSIMCIYTHTPACTRPVDGSMHILDFGSSKVLTAG